MNSIAEISPADLKRIPGLYRRWELPEILTSHGAYRIENAGAHQDGTPLVAVYADAGSDHPDNASAEGSGGAPVLPGTISLRRE